MNYQEYRPGATRPHNKSDLPIIAALREYLTTHAPEQLLRCVSSAAIHVHQDQESDNPALAWLAWQVNELADGNNTCNQEELARLRDLESSLKKSPGRPRIDTTNPKTLAKRRQRDKQK